MYIEWQKIYDLYDKNNKLSGMKFEDIVLEYLLEYYPQYSWKKTQASWDDNRDFVSLVLDNICAEAKYKKNSSALKKQDVDPTMMSGLLNGNIEIIFFITNGYLPDTIIERVRQACRTYSFNIICITRLQLEYWLLLRPKIYECYFKEKLEFKDKLPASSIINNIEIIDYANPNNNLISVKNELIENHFYTMNITFETNIPSKVEIIYKDYPFSFINAPGYAISTAIEIFPGIQQIQLLIHTNRCEKNDITLEYCINGKDILVFSINICIYPNLKPILAYSQQLRYKEEIINLLSDSKTQGQIIPLAGKKGTGKTYLLNDILYHFCKNRQTIYFKFYPKNDYRNKMVFCRLLCYINLGEIIKIFNIENADISIDYYKSLLETKLDPIGGDINLLLEIFEGCYDEVMATKVLEMLCADNNIISKAIIPKITPISHLALIDETENLNKNELALLYNIIKQSISCNSMSFLVADSRNIFPINYELNGLTTADIEDSLRHNFPDWSDSFIKVISKELNNNPSFFSETIQFLKINLKGAVDEDLLSNYVLLSDKKRLVYSLELNCDLSPKYIHILCFIYCFNNGLSSKILDHLEIAHDQIQYLVTAGYLQNICGKVIACSELYRKLFIQKYEAEFVDTVISYLKKILKMPHEYSDYIFIPDVYSVYCKYAETETNDFCFEIQHKLCKYSYTCDYKNLYAYGKIAYYFINKKCVSELTEDDFISLFYYGISLLHCDRKRGAIEIFKYIKNNVSSDLDIYYRASCELYNNLYNRFEIKGLDTEILITQLELERKIRGIREEELQSALDIRIAYSTCLNRYMMILFMQDMYADAKRVYENYCKYNKQIPASKYSDKYNSMIGEWHLDYARGMSYKNPVEAERYFQASIEMIGENYNEKRYILAKLDFSFFKCVYLMEYESEIDNIHSMIMLLKKRGYENEYIRGIIRENFCKLIYYLNNPLILKSSGLSCIINSMKEQALTAELDTMLYVNGRLAYQVRNYFAALDIMTENYTSAQYYLNQNLKMIKDAGDSYKNITKHNLEHVQKLNTIMWGTSENNQNTTAFLVDPRIW